MYFRVIFVTKSMTEGKPLKLILQFAVPLLFGNLLQQMYNLVDAAIVGRVLGTGALAAVGATSSVQFLVLGFCIGICIGFDEAGAPVFAHCAAGFDNVVVTRAGDVFRYARRPNFYAQ